MSGSIKDTANDIRITQLATVLIGHFRAVLAHGTRSWRAMTSNAVENLSCCAVLWAMLKCYVTERPTAPTNSTAKVSALVASHPSGSWYHWSTSLIVRFALEGKTADILNRQPVPVCKPVNGGEVAPGHGHRLLYDEFIIIPWASGGHFVPWHWWTKHGCRYGL